MFFKIGVLKIFVNFTGKHLCWNFFLIKLQALRPATLLKNTSTQVLSYEICELVKNASSYLGVLPIVVTKVSPIHLQELINNFAFCKHCSKTLLLVEDVTSSHDFGS